MNDDRSAEASTGGTKWRSLPLPVVALALSAAILYLFRIGQTSLWYDEAVSVTVAALPPKAMLDALHHSDAFFGFYYALLHFVVGIDDGAAVTRAVSALAAVAFVLSIGDLAELLNGRRTAIAAALIAVTSPLLLGAAHEARPYTLLLLASTSMTTAFVRYVRRPSMLGLAVYAAICVVGCYVHVFAFLVVLAHAVWTIAYRRRSVASGYAIAFAAIGAAVVPLVRAILAPATSIRGSPSPG